MFIMKAFLWFRLMLLRSIPALLAGSVQRGWFAAESGKEVCQGTQTQVRLVWNDMVFVKRILGVGAQAHAYRYCLSAAPDCNKLGKSMRIVAGTPEMSARQVDNG